MRRPVVCVFSSVAALLLYTGLAGGAQQQAPTNLASANPAPAPAPTTKPYVPPPQNTLQIPAGTTIRVRLRTTLTDKTNKTGDPFRGELSEPIVVDGKEVAPKYSEVDGHLAFVKPSGRVAGKAQMRVVLDKIVTADGPVFSLNSSLEQAQGGVCAHTTDTEKVKLTNTKADQEGTITGCGKSKKGALKDAAIVGGVGAAVGASIGLGTMMTQQMSCAYYGYCPPGGSGIGGDILHGAEIGAGTALIYTIFKHEKHIVLVDGSELTFVVNRTTDATPGSPASTASN